MTKFDEAVAKEREYMKKHLTDEVLALLDFLESRDLPPQRACVVMGAALESLIDDPTNARAFIRVLARKLRIEDELRYMQ
jgi:hypothetical protein